MDLILALKKVYKNNAKEQKYFLEEKQWKELAKCFQLSEKAFLFSCLDFASEFAICPTSRFYVGAVGLGESNRLYFGTNIEFDSFPLNMSIHAEQCLIAMAYSQNEVGLKEIYISSFPCGHCRQFMTEIDDYSNIKIRIKSHPKKTFYLNELLPFPFGPQELKVKERLFSQNNSKRKKIELKSASLEINSILQKLDIGLLYSYSPYTKTPSSVVFELENKKIFIGFSVESCAYNPTMSAFQTAFLQLVMSYEKLEKLKYVYLLKEKNSFSRDELNLRNILKKLMPQAKLILI